MQRQIQCRRYQTRAFLLNCTVSTRVRFENVTAGHSARRRHETRLVFQTVADVRPCQRKMLFVFILAKGLSLRYVLCSL